MKSTVILVLSIFVLSCSSAKYSDNFVYGEKLFTNFINSYLKGEDIAETFFIKTVDVFQRSDDFCSLSRIYLTKYLLNEEAEDNESFLKGWFYSENGNCMKEMNIYAFYSNKEYDLNLLDNYYKTYLKILDKKNITALLEKDKDFPDYFYSRILRNYVRNNNIKSDVAINILTRAMEVDRFNGWTLNLLRDYTLLEKFYTSGGEFSHNRARMELLKRKLHKK